MNVDYIALWERNRPSETRFGGSWSYSGAHTHTHTHTTGK